jgi:hypothetical protein
VGADRKGPLAAFIVVAVIAAILLVTSVRSQAAPGWLGRGVPAALSAVGAPDAPAEAWRVVGGGLDRVVRTGADAVRHATPDALTGHVAHATRAAGSLTAGVTRAVTPLRSTGTGRSGGTPPRTPPAGPSRDRRHLAVSDKPTHGPGPVVDDEGDDPRGNAADDTADGHPGPGTDHGRHLGWTHAHGHPGWSHGHGPAVGHDHGRHLGWTKGHGHAFGHRRGHGRGHGRRDRHGRQAARG